MNRPNFLDNPEAWTRSGSRAHAPAEYANPIELHRASRAWDYVMLAAFLAFVVAVAWGVV